MKQYDAVIKVMEENGGYATLGLLYQKVLYVPGVVWKTKTPFASIRRIVQDDRFFFKIKPGLWALKSQKNNLPNEIITLIKEDELKEEEKKSTHSYYQGLIIEIGNIKGFKTYIPPQDKNKSFLNNSLKSIVSVNNIYKFTYENIIQKIQSIDVFWFNERKFPDSVFEIEYSTDFKGSLLKFLELQDFSVRMYVISDKKREREFFSKINFIGFKPIKNRARFITFDEVSRWHTKSYELMLTENKIFGKISDQTFETKIRE